MYKFLLLCLLAGNLCLAQVPSKKYALIIQNTKFEHGYKLLTYGDSNAVLMKKSLMSQGFPKQNITVERDVTAKKFRRTVADFTKKLPQNAIVTVYLFSHGIQVPDFSGDEKDQEKDGKDEVFICTDSETDKDITEELRTKSIKQKSSIDSSATAITDDEINLLNQSLLSQIGPGGAYLCLLDYCHSVSGLKTGFALPAPGNDIRFESQTSIQGGSKTVQKGSFVCIMASDKKISLEASPSKTGFFARAIDHAIHRFITGPTHQEFYDAFQEYILATSAYPDEGKPLAELDEFKDKLLFNGQWVSNFPDYYRGLFKKVRTTAKGPRSKAVDTPEEVTMTSSFEIETTNPHWYLPNMVVDIFIDSQLKTVGIIKSVRNDTVQVNLPSSFEIKRNQVYAIVPSQRLTEASKKFNGISKRADLSEVLQTLHVPALPITIKNCLNPEKTNTCVPFANKKLVAGDRVEIEMTCSGLPVELYFTVLDVTEPKGVSNAYVADPKTREPVGFMLAEDHRTTSILSSKVSVDDSLGKASLWVLVTVAPVSDEEFRALVIDKKPATTSKIEEADRLPLWDILQHVVYFKQLDYEVVR